jgi:hypothetical protein
MRIITLVACGCACALTVEAGAPPAEPTAVRAMKDELARSMEKLELPGMGKPYFLSYELEDGRSAHVTASFGAITSSDALPERVVHIDVRVGDYALDSSNFGDAMQRRTSMSLPVDDDYDAIRRELWLATDRAYKAAGEELERKQAVIKEEAKDPDQASSFSKDTPVKALEAAAVVEPDLPRLEALAKKLSAVFRTNPDAYRGTVTIYEQHSNRYFVSSEGAHASEPELEVRIVASCATQADDGMSLHDTVSFSAATFDQLPAEKDMVARVEELSREISALRKAPIVDDYGGPVLFRGDAAAQVMRALLAENFSGTPAPKGDRPGMRGMGESELVGKVDQRILPPGVTIVDDPTIDKLAGQVLTGHYHFDDEGIAAQRVSLVENGVFKRFLMSRAPRKGFEHSTGHGRATPVSPARAHPTNLIVTSSKGVSDRDIVRRATAAAKEQDVPYAIVVERLASLDQDDFDPSMFSGDGSIVGKPAIMRRVYADGREELVRGGMFGPIPLRALKDLIAVGSTGHTYHYVSPGLGRRFDALVDAPFGIDVTIVSPPLLFRDLDVKKPHGAQKKPPVAPRP